MYRCISLYVFRTIPGEGASRLNKKGKRENGASLKKRGLKQWLIYMVICVAFDVLLEVLIAHLGISIKPFIDSLLAALHLSASSG